MKERKYMVWGDGIILSMGILDDSALNEIDSYTILNPANIVFYTEQVIDEETGIQKSVLRADVTPYLFNAVVEGENKWTLKDPKIVLDPATTLNEELISTYERAVFVTGKK